MRALEKAYRHSSFWRRLTWRASHPPAALRRWLALRSGYASGYAILLLIFPLALLARMASLLGWALTGYLGAGEPAAAMVEATLRNGWMFLAATLPVWLIMAGLVLVWPFLAGAWETHLRGAPATKSLAGLRGLVAGTALITVLLCSSGYLILTSVNIPVLSTPGRVDQPPKIQPAAELEDMSGTGLAPGDLVAVEWRGSWYPATILDVDGERYFIHYEGYGSSWDEWVEKDRIRMRK